jgi:hypothetical protein
MSTQTTKSHKPYKIEYLNAKKDFTKSTKTFLTWEVAVEWGRKNLENFNINQIRNNNE